MSKPAIASLLRLRPLLPTRSNDKVTENVVKKVPGLPFFRDDRHAQPTRALYRHLLRSTRPSRVPTSTGPNDEVEAPKLDGSVDWNALRVKTREEWRKRKGLTSIPQTRAFLDGQYTQLSTLQAYPSSPDLIAWSHRLASQQAKAIDRMSRTPPNPEVRPYVAGFLRPTYHNPPLPRLKPQPVKLSLMIKSRVKARERRIQYQKHLWEVQEGIKADIDFSRRVRDREGLDDAKEQLAGLRDAMKEVQRGFDNDEKRKAGVYKVGVVRRVDKAKRARQAFKRQSAEQRKKEQPVVDAQVQNSPDLTT